MAEQSVGHRMQLPHINRFLITIRMTAGLATEEEDPDSQDLSVENSAIDRPVQAEGKPSFKSRSLLSFFSWFRRSKTQRGQKKKLGLPNIGNTCFLNATLQALYSLPSFCADIMGQEALWSPKTKTSLKLQRYFGELYKARQGQSSYHGKRRLLRSVKSSLAVYNEEYKEGFQQDAHEFLMLFLMGMKMQGETQQGTSTTPDYVCPTLNFEFKLQCVRTCSSCGNKVYQEEEHNNLSLDLSSCLTDSLALYFKASELECTCWQCLGPQATVSRGFLTLPRVLVLHMKRFCHDGAELRREWMMLSASLQFCLWPPCWKSSRISPGGSKTSPLAKPLPSSASVDQLESSGDRDRFQQGASVQDHSVQSSYHLSAIVSHLGESIDCGHYISNVAEGHGGEWLTLDDSRVTRTDEATVLRDREDTAYLLFYVLSGAGEGTLHLCSRNRSHQELFAPPPAVCSIVR
uniref:ubiquitin carboxyl-terminal hydrolase 37-like n=1 Tax=Centroberyx gerrardi TaxID=166262 RepID=UPI003AACF652